MLGLEDTEGNVSMRIDSLNDRSEVGNVSMRIVSLNDRSEGRYRLLS